MGNLGPAEIGIALVLLVVKVIAPIAVVAGGAWFFFTKTEAGRGVAGRVPGGGDTGERLLLLESEVGELRRELSEMHERLDFAERMLANPSFGLPQAGTGEDTPTPPEVAAAR